MNCLRPVLGFALAAIANLTAAPVLAQGPSVAVEGAWSRASLVASRPGVLYLEIANTGDDAVTLTGLETEAAARSEIHRSTTSPAGVSRMEPAGPIEIAPGETVSLEPGGLHGMLMKLQAPLEEGDRYSVKLIFANGEEVEVEVPVLGVTATGPDR